MSDNISQEKMKVRERMKALRQGLSPEEVALESRAVATRVLSLSEIHSAGAVCAYASVGKEVATAHIMSELLETGRVVAVPDWEGWKQGSGLQVARIYEPGDLEMENRVVPQPKLVSERTISIDDIELFLVPGLAFDRSCHRIGMGGGYYDRLLSLSSPEATLIGLAYDFQVMSSLPVDGHDVPVHRVVTPSQVLSDQFHYKRRVHDHGNG